MKIKAMICISAVFAFSMVNCASISNLERVKLRPGEGVEKTYPLNIEWIEPIVVEAMEKNGIIFDDIIRKEDYRQIMAYTPSHDYDYGALFGAWLFPLPNNKTKVVIVKRRKHAVQIFSRDYTEKVFKDIDHEVTKLLLEARS